MAAGVAASFIYTIHAGYETGAANYGGIFTGGLAQFPWDNLVKKAKEPFGIQWKPVGFMGIGAIITGLLMTVRYRYPAWPLHPVGFAAGPVIPANYLLLSFLAAWFIKKSHPEYRWNPRVSGGQALLHRIDPGPLYGGWHLLRRGYDLVSRSGPRHSVF